MNALDVHLLVSCVNGGGLFMVSPEGVERWSRVDTTGIALVPGGAILARQAEGRAELRRLLDGGCDRVELTDRSLDLHDVRAHGEHLLVVATQVNTVFEFDGGFREVRHWSMPGEEDSQHINSACGYEGRVIASRFGQFHRHRGYSGNSRGAGEVFDVETGEVLVPGLSQPHSLLVVGDELWLCDSEASRIAVFRSGGLVREHVVDGYPRGLAVDGDVVIVGLSRSRNAQPGMLESATVLVLDRETMQERARIALPVNEIYDIRVIPPEALPMLRKAAFADAVAEYDTQVHERNLAVARVQHEAAAALEGADALDAARQESQALRERALALETALAEASAARESEANALAEERCWSRLLDDERLALRAVVAGLQAAHEDSVATVREQQAWIEAVARSRSWRWTRTLRSGVPLAPEIAAAAPPTADVPPASRGAIPVFGLEFPEEATPLVTVVVAACGGFEMTRRCLESLQADPRRPALDVILVEDASGDPEMDRFAAVPGLRYVRNSENLGYLRSMNAAFPLARAPYTCLLNNDTVVTPGWLEALLRTFALFQDCGIAGARLLQADGRLQEAGGIVWNDGGACNHGIDEVESRVDHETVREVDYVSAAAVVLRTAVLAGMGGFDARYAPAYYEDTDLAFRLRETGLRAYYQPGAVVVHEGGASHGVDEAVGGKRHQAINRQVFAERWQGTLEREQLPPGLHPFLARARGQLKRSVLVVDGAPPRPERDAGSRAIWHLLQALKQIGLDVRFWSTAPVEDPLGSDLLAMHGFELFDAERSGSTFEQWFASHAAYFDQVLVSRPGNAEQVMAIVRRHSDAPIVYYGHDIHHLRLERQARVEDDADLLRAAERIRGIEHRAWGIADWSLYPTPEETAIVQAWCDASRDVAGRAATVPLFVYDVPAAMPDEGHAPGPQRRDILFVGGFAHAPNADGLAWFLRESWPRIAQQQPQLRVVAVGAEPGEELAALAGERVLLAGAVDEATLQACYGSARVAIAPLRFGAGLKGKVIEALHHGVPCVTTRIGAEGLGDVSALRVEDGPDAFADAVLALASDDVAWRQASAGGREAMAQRFSPDAMAKLLQQVLETAPYPDVAARLERLAP